VRSRDSRAADIGDPARRVADPGDRELASEHVLLGLLGRGLSRFRSGGAEELRVITDRTGTGHEREQERRRRVERLGVHVASHGPSDLLGRVTVEGEQQLLELAGIAGDIPVDLVA
jgi:hypothetical protein